jgi:hypothetical protein
MLVQLVVTLFNWIDHVIEEVAKRVSQMVSE